MSRKPALPTVDLSLDMDFFSREEFLWDWGHNENGEIFQSDAIWHIRYSHLDLFTETDPAVHADFMPVQLFDQLQAKNIRLVNQVLPDGTRVRPQSGHFGLADSHRWAFDFWTKRAPRGPADLLINIDAHHDCFGSRARLDCGNWLRLLLAARPGTQALQLYPKWKDPADDPPPNAPGAQYTQLQWKDWPGLAEPHQLRHVFLCRSGVWLPPHFDADWLALAHGFAYWLPKSQFYQPEPIRQRWAPGAAEARAMFRDHQRQREEFLAKSKPMRITTEVSGG